MPYLHFLLYSNELLERNKVVLQIVHSTLVGMLFDGVLVHLKRVLQLFLVAHLLLLYLSTTQSKQTSFRCLTKG